MNFFLSYKRSGSDDTSLAKQIKDALEADGHDVFIDTGIRIGTDWVSEIGRRIEMMGGISRLLLVVLVSSLAANFQQYFMSGPSLFGGMSGVVFGLLGYALVWSRLVPTKDLGLPVGIYIFMLAFLVIGFSGAIDFLLPGTLANGAHLGGLLGGIAVGLLAVALERDGSEKA